MLQQLPSKKTMYRALLHRDSKFEGIFFVGVKTTGIFCRPTCPARKPKLENIEFYSSAKDALSAGYRPCKRCKPLQSKDKTPDWVNSILSEVDKDTSVRWKDKNIEEFGVNPNRLRRWFKKNHDTTFHGYLRLRRLGNAIGQIKHGENNTTEAAYNNGYESLSGFREAIRNLIGKPIKKGKTTTIIHLNRISTPLGPMLAGTTEKGLCLLEFVDRRMLEKQMKRIAHYLNGTFIPGSNPIMNETARQIREYFEGRLKMFSIPLELPGSDFQQKVWQQLLNIPYGKTRSYQEQAQHIGNENAVRAVARANGDNRLAIVIPCHRVIGKDGHLTGYGGGIWRKKYLLELEEKYSSKEKNTLPENFMIGVHNNNK